MASEITPEKWMGLFQYSGDHLGYPVIGWRQEEYIMSCPECNSLTFFIGTEMPFNKLHTCFKCNLTWKMFYRMYSPTAYKILIMKTGPVRPVIFNDGTTARDYFTNRNVRSTVLWRCIYKWKTQYEKHRKIKRNSLLKVLVLLSRKSENTVPDEILEEIVHKII